MAPKALQRVLNHVRRISAVQTARALTDAELLDRFLASDDAAFTVLVERHGPAVLGVCRRALGDAHDAEDACQATFLVLARKAASIRKKPSLTSWLHGVACRVAATLKRGRQRQLLRERASVPPTPPTPDTEVAWRELQAVLDQELHALPERYRCPLLLCCVEGRTRDEAAGLLGLTLTCLNGRVERGRKLLRDRLTRRGLTLSAALLSTTLGSAARAALEPTLVIGTVKAAARLAAGQPIAGGTAPALSLAQEVLRTMFLTKLKGGLAALLCAGALAALLGAALPSVGTAQEGTGPVSKPAAGTTRQAPAKAESDEEFIRRVSKDLRGTDPTPAEVHFFAATRGADKRQRLIDLFIQERQAKAEAARQAEADQRAVERDRLFLDRQYLLALDRDDRARLDYSGHRAGLLALGLKVSNYGSIQRGFYKELLAAGQEKKEVAAIAQAYLDRLLQYVKEHPGNEDVADAMAQIVLVYSSQGKAVEAEAWRARLLKEHPSSPAAKAAKEGKPMDMGGAPPK